MIEKYLPINWEKNERSVITYKHSLMVAKAAKLIAAKCNLNEELAYVYGEMHDIGKFFLLPKEFYKHPRLGYEMLLKEMLIKDNKNIAQICITHSFPIINNNVSNDNTEELNNYILAFCHNDKEESNLLINILNTIQTNDYIQLIQFCDKISTIDKYIPIETKLHWYQEKHHISSSDLNKFYGIPLNNIREKFNKLLGIDMYQLLNIK